MMICSLLIKLLISRWREPLCTFQLLAALSSRHLPHIAHPTLAEFTLALAELSSALALIVIPLLLRDPVLKNKNTLFFTPDPATSAG